MNQVPISKCYFPLIEHTTDLSHANSIHTNSDWYFKTQSGISNSAQIPISLVTLVISIQYLYMTKYKYTINYNITIHTIINLL